jgi:hypothetical protein
MAIGFIAHPDVPDAEGANRQADRSCLLAALGMQGVMLPHGE